MRTTVPAKLNFPVPIPLSKLSPDDEQNQQDIFINKRFVLKKRFILLQGILNLNNTKHLKLFHLCCYNLLSNIKKY